MVPGLGVATQPAYPIGRDAPPYRVGGAAITAGKVPRRFDDRPAATKRTRNGQTTSAGTWTAQAGEAGGLFQIDSVMPPCQAMWCCVRSKPEQRSVYTNTRPTAHTPQ